LGFSFGFPEATNRVISFSSGNIVVSALVGHLSKVQAFALLGPYANWMDVTNGFRQPGDIGGPMNVGEEYRWNVPVVTYGFEKCERR
jgi:hypothetical protein